MNVRMLLDMQKAGTFKVAAMDIKSVVDPNGGVLTIAGDLEASGNVPVSMKTDNFGNRLCIRGENKIDSGTVATIFEMIQNGAFSDGQLHRVEFMGGVCVSESQLKGVVNSIGWVSSYLKPKEIIKKTDKFLSGFQNVQVNSILDGSIMFENSRISNSTGSYDRIVIQTARYGNVTIVYNMPHSGGKYCIYNNGALPVKTAARLSGVVSYLNSTYI